MSNEITITASLSVNKASIMSVPFAKSLTGWLFNMTGNFWVAESMNVPTTATAIPLGNVTTPHWAYFRNMDPTNYLQIQNGATGAVLLRLLGGAFGSPVGGEFAICPLDQGATPYAIANTAAVLMEYAIFSA